MEKKNDFLQQVKNQFLFVGQEFETFLKSQSLNQKISSDKMEFDILRHGVFFNIFFYPIHLDENHTISSSTASKTFVEPWPTAKYPRTLYDFLSGYIQTFQLLVHPELPGKPLTKNELVSSSYNKKERVSPEPELTSQLFSPFPGRFGSFWVEFHEVEILYHENQPSFRFLTNETERASEYMASVYRDLPNSLIDEKRDSCSRVILPEFRGFCIYACPQHGERLLNLWLKSIFNRPGQLEYTFFTELANSKTQDFSSVVYREIFNRIFQPIFLTQRKPIWVK